MHYNADMNKYTLTVIDLVLTIGCVLKYKLQQQIRAYYAVVYIICSNSTHTQLFFERLSHKLCMIKFVKSNHFSVMRYFSFGIYVEC